MSERMGAEHYGAERGETAMQKAERIIAVELKRRRWTEAEIKKRPKGDPAKVKLAQQLRAETVQTVAWIAQ
jgi:predicted Fe-Mo cluster-binding NifX family protein